MSDPSSAPVPASRGAFRELLELLRAIDDDYLSPARNIAAPADVAEGEHMLLHLLKAAIDLYVDNDAGRPLFAPLAHRTLKFGGDGPDNPVFFAPLDPARRYRIRGRRNGEVYISFTVYRAREAGDFFGDGVASALNDREFRVDAQGRYELTASAAREGGDWLALDPSCENFLVARHYFMNPVPAVADPSLHVELEIENLESAPPFPLPLSPDALARKLRAAARFLRGWTLDRPPQDPATTPRWFSLVPNQLPKPERFDAASGGAGSPDNAYCAGLFVLAPEQALVIEGELPRCAYANVVLWNRFMQSFDFRYRRVALHKGQMRLGPDGRSYRLVLAQRDPGLPGWADWLDTEGRAFGTIYWRFLLPEGDLPQPRCRVLAFEALAAEARRA